MGSKVISQCNGHRQTYKHIVNLHGTPKGKIISYIILRMWGMGHFKPCEISTISLCEACFAHFSREGLNLGPNFQPSPPSSGPAMTRVSHRWTCARLRTFRSSPARLRTGSPRSTDREASTVTELRFEVVKFVGASVPSVVA